jgi:3-oxoacyl-[acyl-carrier protein] reductase
MKKRTALVTGATGVIGSTIVKKLKSEGYEVLAPGRAQMDLLSNASIDTYCCKLQKPVDILINNAGINLIASLQEATDENIEKSIQVNLTAPLRLARALAPKMASSRWGRIVNVSSIWGLVTRHKRVTYTMTKSGLCGVTRSLAVELASKNILVNAVAPGYVNSSMTKKNNSPADLVLIRKSIPMQRLAEAGEIAELVAFLVSDKNTYITGQTIAIDGGYTCQ